MVGIRAAVVAVGRCGTQSRGPYLRYAEEEGDREEGKHREFGNKMPNNRGDADVDIRPAYSYQACSPDKAESTSRQTFEFDSCSAIIFYLYI